MNRLSFIIQSLKGKPISTDELIRYFDNRIAAYEVFKQFDITNVYYEPCVNDFAIKIKAQVSNKANLEKIESYINNILHNRKDLYCKLFNIDTSNDGSLIEMKIKQER